MMDLSKFVTQVQNGEEDDFDDEDVNDTHVRGKHMLDPKVIQKLELEILKSMAVGKNVDASFNVNLPDASIATATTSIVATSIFNSSTSFTMESFTENTLSSLFPNEPILFDKSTGQEVEEKYPCSCCIQITPNYNMIRAFPNADGLLLPPQLSNDRGKICLVLDLDETLVHSSFLAIPHADYRFDIGIDQSPVGVFVCVRPGAEKFLKELGSLYEIIIFTASCQVYADPVKYRLYRESCTKFNGSFVKDLSKMNRPLEKIIIIDNSSVSYLLQPYNAIPISSWFDDPTDNELFVIMDKLKRNYRAKNIHSILYPE
ncbi:NLI interacting factor-like phosphatase family protein [Trichomonas vaginalis G3]|uniref:NLI interacting factor-like phosphatase family protein n=1 Tax=Trichomonas vaginalis (strain ATCC PRA-98 / G3) TaxID=412133 RepID=A2E9M9_TRIV3|nr:phosphoprotein phosphatase protein [Trichomonas vaginalis G3]EAY10680.1 NLI interacting factor-like phosphatase family protein [Trichomonas vaginalis G3]KAI5512178.1 phosphoprotein phosphatase protein [Trichomonas vaginalis G3]|eukprot:XP_001322903.1 NLI interacting factor-like phosphatase family protein [Trichomonas vaginalis G3]